MTFTGQKDDPSKKSSWRKWWPEERVDLRFATVLGLSAGIGIPVGYLTGEIVMPHAEYALCAFENRFSHRQGILLKEQTCQIYYAKNQPQKCEIKDKTLTVHTQDPRDAKSLLRFTAKFNDAGQILEMHQATVTPGAGGEILKGVPIEVFFDESELIREIRLAPGEPLRIGHLSSEQVAIFRKYETVASYLREFSLHCDGTSSGTIESLVKSGLPVSNKGDNPFTALPVSNQE